MPASLFRRREQLPRRRELLGSCIMNSACFSLIRQASCRPTQINCSTSAGRAGWHVAACSARAAPACRALLWSLQSCVSGLSSMYRRKTEVAECWVWLPRNLSLRASRAARPGTRGAEQSSAARWVQRGSHRPHYVPYTAYVLCRRAPLLCASHSGRDLHCRLAQTRVRNMPQIADNAVPQQMQLRRSEPGTRHAARGTRIGSCSAAPPADNQDSTTSVAPRRPPPRCPRCDAVPRSAGGPGSVAPPAFRSSCSGSGCFRMFCGLAKLLLGSAEQQRKQSTSKHASPGHCSGTRLGWASRHRSWQLAGQRHRHGCMRWYDVTRDFQYVLPCRLRCAPLRVVHCAQCRVQRARVHSASRNWHSECRAARVRILHDCMSCITDAARYAAHG